MKILMTFTSIVALIVGMSVANAQNSTSQDKAGSTNSSATGSQTIGNAKFCITGTTGGAMNCKYASLAACEKAAKVNNQTCSPNPKSGTTGAK